MKKNMISVIILALLIVNIALTGVMMFSIVSTEKKTAKLIDGISTALNLELTPQSGSSAAESTAVPMEDITVYSIADAMTIPLKDSGDGKDHFVQVSVSFSINNKADDYKKYGSGGLSAQQDLIKNEIVTVFESYTLEDAKANQDTIKKEILKRVQKLYNSDFIFNVSFSNILYQ
jgi:flagellar FliL protein